MHVAFYSDCILHNTFSLTGESCTSILPIIGSAVAAVVVLFTVVVVEFVIIVKIKRKRHRHSHTHPNMHLNPAYGPAINRVILTRENLAYDHQGRMLNRAQQHNMSSTLTPEPPHSLPEYHEVSISHSTAKEEQHTDTPVINMRP